MFKIEKVSKKASISRTVRFTEKIFEELNEIAKENKIPFSLLVTQCCKYAIENSEDREDSK
jgi:hypothetical protein